VPWRTLNCRGNNFCFCRIILNWLFAHKAPIMKTLVPVISSSKQFLLSIHLFRIVLRVGWRETLSLGVSYTSLVYLLSALVPLTQELTPHIHLLCEYWALPITFPQDTWNVQSSLFKLLMLSSTKHWYADFRGISKEPDLPWLEGAEWPQLQAGQFLRR
jgi:hypothetical protein